MESTTKTETIVGRFQKIIMRDYKSGFTIFKVLTKAGPVVCKGNIIPPNMNMKIEATGSWETSEYGQQLVGCSIQEVFADTESMQEYLCTIPGVGAKTASELIDRFGERLYYIALESNGIERLCQLPSISKNRAEVIADYIRQTQEQRKLFELISQHGGTYNASLRIYKEHGVNSIVHLLERPYEVGSKGGLSFQICDQIAKGNHFPAYCRARVTAALYHVLRSKVHSSGDTYVPHNELVKATREMLSGSTDKEIAYNEAIAAAVINACLVTTMDGIIKERKDVFLSNLYYQEIKTAYAIKRLIRDAIPIHCDPDALCMYAEKTCDVTYADQQREAFHLLKSGGVSIITGGPGTGKTTLIKGLLAAYERLFPHNIISLCAPTGRASQRMKEATGREATTIHRLLEYRPFGNTAICKNESNPIAADLLIVDEGSMISIDIADLLFSALKPGTMVIIVGDTNQLPSVGPGNVLHDLIRSEIIPVVALTKTHRQASDSNIIKNAKKIQEGLIKLEEGSDFSIIECETDAEIPDIVKSQYVKFHDPDNPFAVQALTPSRKHHSVGSNALNNAIQAVVNPIKNCLHYSDTSFRVGDKVMMMRNNYGDGVEGCCYYNGDIGIIKSIQDNSLTILIDKEEITVGEDLLDDVSLAYACTTHKSQGSEFDIAIVVLPAEPASMLQRNLLYTAITRAKKKVVLIATKGAKNKAIYTANASRRKSRLAFRLRGNTDLEGEQT